MKIAIILLTGHAVFIVRSDFASFRLSGYTYYVTITGR